MIHVTLLAVGKVKDPHLAALCREYMQRLQRFARVQVEEVRDATGTSPAEVMAREAQEIVARLKTTGFCVALHRQGRHLTSVELSEWLQQRANQGQSDLTFIIGGPQGLASSILHKAQFKLSLSSMTFTHEMARVILLEQLYRAMTIWQGQPYHRGGD